MFYHVLILKLKKYYINKFQIKINLKNNLYQKYQTRFLKILSTTRHGLYFMVFFTILMNYDFLTAFNLISRVF